MIGPWATNRLLGFCLVLVVYLTGSALCRARPVYSGILLSAQKYNEAVHGSSKNVFLSNPKPSSSSSNEDMNLYVYIPEENRVVVIKVGNGAVYDPVEVDADANVTTPAALDPAALFMKLTPNLKNLLNPVDISNFLAALNGLNVLSPASLATYSTIAGNVNFKKPLDQLSLLVNALNDISPSNPLVLTNILTILSTTDTTNPLAALTNFLKVIGIVNPLNPDLLVKIFNILQPTVLPLKQLWSLMKNETLQELERPIFVKPDLVDNGSSSEDIRPYETTTAVVFSTLYITVAPTTPMDEPVAASASVPPPALEAKPSSTSAPVEPAPMDEVVTPSESVSPSAVDATPSPSSAPVELAPSPSVDVQPPSTSEPIVELQSSMVSITETDSATTTAELVQPSSSTSEPIEPMPTMTSEVSAGEESTTATSADLATRPTTIPVTIEYQNSLSTEIAASSASLLPSAASDIPETSQPASVEPSSLSEATSSSSEPQDTSTVASASGELQT